jgi:hypothetical protein
VSAASRGRSRDGAWRAGALGAALLAHGGSLFGGFVWDDLPLVRDNPRLAGGLGQLLAGGFWTGAGAEAVPYFRPLTLLSYALDRALWGVQPFGYHLTNLGLHLVCVALVFAAARVLLRAPAWAGLAAALFGTLPRATQSVAWVSGRTDLLCAVFTLGAFTLYIRARRGGRIALELSPLCAALAMLAKETAFVLPLALAAAEALCLPARRRAWRPFAWHAGLAAALFAVRGAALRGLPGSASGDIPLVLASAGHYAQMLLWPFAPSSQIGTRASGVGDPWSWAGVAAGVAWAAALALSLHFARRDRVLAFGLAWTAVFLAPVLNIVALRMHVPAADHLLYLPHFGWVLVLVRLCARLRRHARRVVRTVVVAGVACFALLSALRTLDWRDEETFWAAAAEEAAPDNPLPHHELAGLALAAGRVDEALAHARAAADALARMGGRAHPENRAAVLRTLARVLAARGESKAALDALDDLPPDPSTERLRAQLRGE